MKKRFSIIVPVYNRVDEVEDLLRSLNEQTVRDFEVIIVEDGSTSPCGEVCKEYSDRGLDVKYFYKENEGRSIARNYGMKRADGNYFLFFDSDCVIPENYILHLTEALERNPLDCFGGPDAAHDSFTAEQKAINFAMTSFFTTGGIRGGKISMEKFVPRTFNLGFSRAVYDCVGEYREMFSEDIDMSTRIRNAGFSIGLIREAYVYHKRRVDFKKFWRQVHIFGQSRMTLKTLYPDSLKLVHLLPSFAVILGIILLVMGITISWWWLLPFALWIILIFVSALIETRSVKVSLLAIPASVIQIVGYGTGFIKAFFVHTILGRGRDVTREIEIRKGKNERLDS